MQSSSTNRRKVAALLFGSGLCALVYQTVWMRQFRLIFGASTPATAAVLAMFMGGLGLGSALLGKRADRHPNPLRFYGDLELLIAFSAALSQPLLWIAAKIYIAIGGGVALRPVLAALVLAIPTVLMGGTLPAAARAVETADDAGRRRLALLYGINTLGAVTGALASTFFMLETFGNRQTLFIAVLINLLVTMTARAISAGAMQAETAQTTEQAASQLSAKFVFAAAAISGFAFLLMELVWYRMLGPILGGSTFTFGLILAVALLGIAIGGTAYGLWSSGTATAGAFALTCTLEAALLMLPYALGDRLALLANYLRVIGHAGFGGFVFGWSIITAIVVLPPAIVAGVQFPLLIALLGRGRDDIGAHVGRAYAWNTLGAIAGSLAGGFGFLPLFTAKGCWIIASMLLVVTGIAAARRVMPLLFATLAVAAAFALGPTAVWRHTGIGAGRAGVPSDLNDIRRWQNANRKELVWEADGRESAIGLIDDDDFAFYVNGKSDGAARGDAETQVMAGLTGAMLHPDPHSALVVGLGTGSTAGWLGAVPSIDRVDVVELEPVVLRVAKDCTAVNHDVLHNPKVHIRIGDAREVLLTTRNHYDIVFSEPSNPYRAGIASLFTREFYEAVRARLNRGGMFLQWVQSYDIDAETVRTIYATMGAAFPQVMTWRTGEGDLLLIASTEPVTIDIAKLQQRVTSEPYRSALHGAWRVESVDGFLAHFLASDRLTRVCARDASMNTDDRTAIEFGFARAVGDTSRFHMNQILFLASVIHADRPERVAGPFDWQRALLHRSMENDLTVPAGVPEQMGHHDAAAAWSNSNFNGVLLAWTEHGKWQPLNSSELAMLAEAMIIGAAKDDPSPLLASLRQWEPIEADTIEARLMVRRGDTKAAAELLRRAFVAYRTNPWPQPLIMARAIDFAAVVGTLDKSTAPVLYDALAQRFAAGQNETTRLAARVSLGRRIDGCGPHAIAALRALEPWVPWDRPTLELRADCYAKAGLRELASRAQEELGDFIANQPQPLAR